MTVFDGDEESAAVGLQLPDGFLPVEEMRCASRIAPLSAGDGPVDPLRVELLEVPLALVLAHLPNLSLRPPRTRYCPAAHRTCSPPDQLYSL